MKTQADRDLELVMAAMRGDLPRVELCLKRNADPNAVVGLSGSASGFLFNTTALTEAAEGGDVQIIRLLLQKQADPNVQVKNGWSPLMKAAAHGRTEAALLLIESGADVTASREQILDSVLQPGFDSALSHAAARGDQVLVKALIKAGAFPLRVYDITKAWNEGHDDVVLMIFSISENPVKNPEVMAEAARQILLGGQSKSVSLKLKKLLLEKWVDLDRTLNPDERAPVGGPPRRVTALSIAVQSGESSLVQDLLARGAKIDLQPLDYFGITNPEIVKLLKAADPKLNFNTQDAFGTAPLHCVNNPQVARLLLTYGAKIDIANRRGETPLALACNQGNVELVKLYLEYSGGIKASMPSIDPQAFRQRIQLAKMPLSRLNELLEIAVALDRPELIDALIEAGVSIAEKPTSGKLMSIAAGCNAARSLRYLVSDMGIDVETPNYFQATSLYIAAVSNNLEALRVLIELGAEVDATFNSTPLYWAADKGNLEVMRLLLDAGAQDLDAGLNAALREGHIEAVKLLIEKGAIVDRNVMFEVERISRRKMSAAERVELKEFLRGHLQPNATPSPVGSGY